MAIEIAISIFDEDRDRDLDRDLKFGDRGHALQKCDKAFGKILILHTSFAIHNSLL